MLYLLQNQESRKYYRLIEAGNGIEEAPSIRSAMFFPSDFCDAIVREFPGVGKIVYGTSGAVESVFFGKICEYKAVKYAEKRLYDLTGVVS